MNVVSSYSDKDIRNLVLQTMPTIFIAAAFIAEFLDYPAEHQRAVEMFAEHVQFQKDVFAQQAEVDKLKPKS